jgi:hypothetical protein
MKKYWVWIVLGLLIISCKDKENRQEKNEIAPVQEQQQARDVPHDLMALPEAVFKKIYFEADYLDVIFQELPFSMSQENNASIRQIMNHIDNKPPASMPAGCPLFGQQIYQKNGETILEADFYHSPGCYYFIFRYGGDQYFNGMTDSGVEFYENLKKRSI